MLLRLLFLEPGSSREALEGIPESPLRAMVTCSADREVLSNLLLPHLYYCWEEVEIQVRRRKA